MGDGTLEAWTSQETAARFCQRGWPPARVSPALPRFHLGDAVPSRREGSGLGKGTLVLSDSILSLASVNAQVVLSLGQSPPQPLSEYL